jgi:hypothetical protein
LKILTKNTMFWLIIQASIFIMMTILIDKTLTGNIILNNKIC